MIIIELKSWLGDGPFLSANLEADNEEMLDDRLNFALI